MSNNRNWPEIAAHSMTIGGMHTFRDWSMVPAEIPVFAPPTPKYNYIDVPQSNGSLDYTEKLDGRVYYNNRTGSFSFIVLNDVAWPTAYSNVMRHLHGQRMRCVLDDDPNYFYEGRFAVNEWKSSRTHSTIVIDYTVDPYKTSFDGTRYSDWLWDDPFEDTVIYYGTFEVSGTKTRNLINPSGDRVTPTFICSNPMTVTFGGTTHSLVQGTTTPSFSLAPGNNIMTFSGNGTVLCDYSTDKRL